MSEFQEQGPVRAGDRVLRTLIVAGAVGLLASLSFVFMPAGSQVREGEIVVGRPVRAVVVDRSPLRGVALDIPDVRVRRLDQVAVVTFSCAVFDERQELRPAARERLLELARGLHAVRDRIAVEIAGYAPDARDSNGYTVGLLRAARVADCIAGVAGIPPAAIALRSLADTEVVGSADRPHAVVITISTAVGAARLAGTPVACL